MLLASLGTMILCVQVCAFRLARSNGGDLWPAVARATAQLVRAR